MGQSSFFAQPESWFTIITAGTAVVAIWQTKHQTLLSNKHQLFDRRIEKYSIFKDLLSKYSQKRETFLNDKQLDGNADIYIESLIDVPCLEDLFSALDNPLDDDNHAHFLDKCTWLKKQAIEMSIIFNGKGADLLKAFCKEYANLLGIVYYEYMQIVYDVQVSMRDLYKDDILKEEGKPESDDTFIETVFQPADDTITEAVNRIESIYQKIVNNNIEEKIVKQIKLK